MGALRETDWAVAKSKERIVKVAPRRPQSVTLTVDFKSQAKVAVALDDGEPDMAALVRQRLPNVRHQMWNGQWHAAIARMKTIYQGTREAAPRIGQAAGEHMQRFRKHLRDLRDYLVDNQTSLTNYAHAYRNGPRISSAPADVLDRRRRAPAASGMLRSTRRQIGRPIPRAVSEISPHIAGAGIARFVTVHPHP
jgi:hypothetical protein